MTSPISLRRVRRPLTSGDLRVANESAPAVAEPRAPDPSSDPALDAVDARFKALADPTRLRILNLLAAGELCVCDVVEILLLPQPTVSRHLASLRRSGLVAATRSWKFAHYRLSPPSDAVHDAILAAVAASVATVPSLASERAMATQHAAQRARQPCD